MTMDTDKLSQRIRKRFDHNQAKRVLREKYSALRRLRKHNMKLVEDYQITLSSYQHALTNSSGIVDRANEALHFIRYAHPLYFRHKKLPCEITRPNTSQLNLTDPYNNIEDPNASIVKKQKHVTFFDENERQNRGKT